MGKRVMDYRETYYRFQAAQDARGGHYGSDVSSGSLAILFGAGATAYVVNASEGHEAPCEIC